MRFREAFAKGDAATKASALVFGLGCAVRGQLARGLAFLLAEAIYIIYMASFGWGYVSMLPSLGKNQQGWVFDEAQGIDVMSAGDNSMLILLFGVVSLFVAAAAVYTAAKSVKASYGSQLLAASGKKLPGIADDLRSLLDKNLHVTMLSIPVLGVVAFTVLPLVFMILMAFTNFDRFHQPPGNLFTWIGFGNFTDVFWQNPHWSSTFLRILGWTMIWAVFATFTNFFFGMAVALMINKKGIKLKKLWRTVFVMTIAVPQFVSLMLMSRILHNEGPLNVLLQQLRLVPGAVHFLTDGTLARVTVIVVNLWVGIPYTILSTTGILMNIPAEQYESAHIDGANVIQEFMHITLPHMIFVMTPALITAFVGNINNFNVIYFLTGGGPNTLDYFQGGKTDLLVTWLYKLTVNEQNYSLASTIGIMIFFITATLSLIVYNHSGSIKNEEGYQ